LRALLADTSAAWLSPILVDVSQSKSNLLVRGRGTTRLADEPNGIRLEIKEIQLTITASDSSSQWSGLQSTRLAQRISGDLDRWHLGKEREQADMRDTYVQTTRESVPERNATEPLKFGTLRVGWLHFRLRNITPEEFRTAPMELLVEDSLCRKHVTAIGCPRNLPGKVWPTRGKKAQRAAADVSLS